MRPLLVLLLLACALPASAQRSRNTCRVSRDRSCNNDTAAFRLLPTVATIPGGECSGQAITGTRGETLTVTRASSAYCTKSDGTLVLLSANQPRVAFVGGVPKVLRETQGTNLVPDSQAIDAASWTKNTGTTVVATNVLAPDGTNTAERIDFGASFASSISANFWVRFSGTLTAGLPMLCSVYLQTDSGTNTLYLGRTDTTTWSGMPSQAATATTTWQRFELSFTQTGTSSDFVIGYEGAGNRFPSARFVNVWQADCIQSSFRQSPIKTSGGSATRNADQLAITTPAAWDPANWCVGMSASPINSGGWNIGANRVLWVNGAYSTANTSHVYFDGSGNLKLDSFDSGGTVHSITHAAPATSAFFRACNRAGAISLRGDGAASGADGTGATQNASPSTIYVGGDSTGGGGLNGNLGDFCIGPAGACAP